jgi:hypothetical protein
MRGSHILILSAQHGDTFSAVGWVELFAKPIATVLAMKGFAKSSTHLRQESRRGG